jgi:predicted esterase
MIEGRIRTPRTARYYATGEVTAATQELWIACHGYAQLARYFVRPFAEIASTQRVIVAPEALNRYYFETAPGRHGPDAKVAATWMTREDREHEMVDYIEYLDNVTALMAGHAAPDAHITALGFSQGSATVSRWAARGRTRLDRVILWGAAIPPELEPGPSLFRGADLVLAIGTADEHVSEAAVARQEARLSDAGMPHRLHRYEGGHRINAQALAGLLRILDGGQDRRSPTAAYP